jgi:threonine aldolase
MNFCSDNTAGVHPKILAALASANPGNAMPYGNDDITARVEARLAEIFERDCTVALVATGTAANALALATLVPAWGVVYCHPDSHINTDECGAPEFYTGGKLVAVPGADGKMNAADLDAVLATAGAGVVHHAQPAAISITQATEAGTVYRPAEIAAIGAVARKHKLALHMDGARFANALVTLGCSPADMTWRAGVDAVSFGCTKNGALAAEAIVMFDRSKAAELGLRRKRAGQLWSKLRYISAQIEAYLAADLWLASARHANKLAAQLAKGINQMPGVKIVYPVEANEIFVEFATPVRLGLEKDGFRFYSGMGPGGKLSRLVTAWDSEAAHVEAFIASARRHGSQAAAE